MNHPPPLASAGKSTRHAALDSLRAFITLLVIAHHAVLAYHPYAPALGTFTGADLAWGAFPIVDAARGQGLDLFTLWNDSFFMMLMFLLSGLFVGPSLQRKGVGQFLRDRLVRIGAPFLLGTLVLAPLAYYPAYLQRAAATAAGSFWDAWLALGCWPAGPMWFLWVLLVFAGLAAVIQQWSPQWRESAARFSVWGRDRPLRMFLILTIAALAAYLPTTLWLNSTSWAYWGPFFIQTSRIGLYAVYFFFGVALGADNLTTGLLSLEGKLAQRWMLWHVIAAVAFIAFVAVLIITLTAAAKSGQAPSLALLSVVGIASGAATSFALLATFLRWPGARGVVWASLARNAFAMYVIHYVIVTWLQFSLLPIALPGVAKAAATTLLAVALSWMGAGVLRRIPIIARIV